MANDQETNDPAEPGKPATESGNQDAAGGNPGAPKPDQPVQAEPDAFGKVKRENATLPGKDDDQNQASETGGTQKPESQTKVAPDPPQNIALSDNPEVKVDDNISAEIQDALSLLEFGIASGFTTAAGKGIADTVVIAINRTSVKARSGNLKLSDWVNFEIAYHWLATVLAPVSAETLKNTHDEFPTREQRGKASPARRFAKRLWYWTAAFAFIIIAVELGQKAGGAPETPALVSTPPTRKEWLDALMHFGLLVEPYAYGGLGACAYLLRSAHKYIYTRTFDMRRRSEYYNRIILGLVAGGAIFLFVNSNTGEESTSVSLSSGALAFIAGYSNDFLFNAIQRIVNAIFPKTEGDRPIGSPRAPADAPAAPSPLSQGGEPK